MKEIWNWVKVAIATVGGSLGYFLGGCDGFLYALLTFVVMDYITGVMCAILDKKLSSEVGFRGIFILENAAHIDLPVLQKLKDILEQLQNRSEKEGTQ